MKQGGEEREGERESQATSALLLWSPLWALKSQTMSTQSDGFTLLWRKSETDEYLD